MATSPLAEGKVQEYEDGGIDESAGIERMFENLPGSDDPFEDGQSEEEGEAEEEEGEDGSEESGEAEGEDDGNVEHLGEDGEGEETPEADAEAAKHLLDLAKLDKKATVKVVVDGKEQIVPIQEALDGYIRTETFYQRLNQMRDVSKELTAAEGRVNQDRAKYVQGLEQIQHQLASLVPQEPNWEAEFIRDPAAAGKLKLQWDAFNKQRGEIAQELATERQRTEATQARQFKMWAEDQQRQMLIDQPEWNDPKKWDEDKSEMTKVARAVGFSMEEINQIFDARQMKILNMAAKYAKLSANPPKPKPGDKANQNPRRPNSANGAAASRTAPRNRGAAERLAKTGRVRDAARVFEGMLSREE